MHPALLNGHVKATLIESFDGEVSIVRPGFKKVCTDLPEALQFINEKGWEVNVGFIMGSNIQREIHDHRHISVRFSPGIMKNLRDKFKRVGEGWMRWEQYELSPGLICTIRFEETPSDDARETI